MSNRTGPQDLYTKLTNADLWVVPMTGDRTPRVFLETPFRDAWGAFSPDSRWTAYQSNESGRSEVDVRACVLPSLDASADTLRPGSGPAPGSQWQVSTTGRRP